MIAFIIYWCKNNKKQTRTNKQKHTHATNWKMAIKGSAVTQKMMMISFM